MRHSFSTGYNTYPVFFIPEIRRNVLCGYDVYESKLAG